MKRFLASVIFLTLSLGNSAPTLANAREEASMTRALVRGLFYNRKFAELEDLINRFRTTDIRSKSGWFRAETFYSTFDNSDFWNLNVSAKLYDESEKIASDWAKIYPGSSAALVVATKIILQRSIYILHDSKSTATDEEKLNQYRIYTITGLQFPDMSEKIASADPEYYATKMRLLNNFDTNPLFFKNIFENARRKFPDYFTLNVMAVHQRFDDGHMPPERIEDIAQSAMALASPSNSLSIYARVYQEAYFLLGYDMFHNSKVQWSLMKSGLDDIARQYPDPINWNTFAYFACLPEDKPATEAALKEVGSDIDMKIWRSPQILASCKAWSAPSPNQSPKL